MTKKAFKIECREQGRGKPSVSSFATLVEAAKYVQSQWQGADYADGINGFHSDYATFDLIGFTLKDIGRFYFTDDDCREFAFFDFDPDFDPEFESTARTF